MEPDGTLLVFVHGFAGKAMTSWSAFDSLLEFQDKTCHADIVFFGYSSIRQSIWQSASHLTHLISDLVANANGLVATSAADGWVRGSVSYQRICIVAHSMGAVVGRTAVLEAMRRGRSWGKDCELYLYAPAHSGAKMLARLRVLGAWAALLSIGSPVFDDLEPNNARLLALKDEVKERVARGETQLSAKLVVQPVSDMVVFDSDFLFSDASAEYIQHRHHRNVCKPRDEHDESLTKLIGAL